MKNILAKVMSLDMMQTKFSTHNNSCLRIVKTLFIKNFYYMKVSGRDFTTWKNFFYSFSWRTVEIKNIKYVKLLSGYHSLYVMESMKWNEEKKSKTNMLRYALAFSQW